MSTVETSRPTVYVLVYLYSNLKAKLATMAKLTRYTSFKDLKSDENVSRSLPAGNEKLKSEFEAFLNSLQREHSAKKTSTRSYGKKRI